MADNLTDPNIAPPPDPSVQTTGLSTTLTTTLNSTPELTNDPSSAIAIAASGGNPVIKGQSLAHAVHQTNTVAAAHAVQQASGGGLFSDIGHALGDAASEVGKVLNKPLNIVQHEYRYLHDVEARHGAGTAFLEGLGLAAGAVVGGVAGTFAGGNTFEGAALGAEGAGYLEGQATYKDSWARTQNGATYRDPHTHQLVSFGRDLESHLPGPKTVLSGVFDGIADLAADPLALAGKAYAGQKTLSLTADNLDRALHNPLSGLKRAETDIAASDPATIIQHYPQFKDVAQELGAQQTPEDVHDFLRSLVKTRELMDAQKLPAVEDAAEGVTRLDGTTTSAMNLPSLSPLHVPFRAARDTIRDLHGTSWLYQHTLNNLAVGPARWARRLEAVPGNTLDKEIQDVTGWQFDPGTNLGADNMMKMMRYSLGDTTAKMAGNALMDADEAQRVVIFRNAFAAMLAKMANYKLDEEGLDITNPQMADSILENVDGKTRKAVFARLDSHMEQIPHDGSQPGTQMGMDWRGQPIKPVVTADGNRIQGAIVPNQRGTLSIPNVVEARRMAQAIRQAKTSMFLGNVDDFFYDHVTQGLFKPLVLMSAGYALHISLAELIPNTLRHGLRGSVAALRTRALTSLGYEPANLDPADLDGLTGWLYRTLGGGGIKSREQDVRYLIQSRELTGGSAAPPGLAAGENLQADINPVSRAENGMRQVMAQGYREGKRFFAIDNSDPRFADAWHSELSQNVNRYSIPAALRYRQSLADGADWQTAMEDARQSVARVLRREQEEGRTDMLARSRLPMEGAPASWDGIDGHAQAVVDKLMGAVHARPTRFDDAGVALAPGPVHDDLLASIANGRAPTREEVHAIDSSQRPLSVKARDLVPLNDGWVQKVANMGFKKLLNPMVNLISRNQEYTIEYLRLRREMQPLVDAGIKSEDEVTTEAMAKAIQHGLRFVHNLHDRTQWTMTMRNWAPFFFAQEQAYRRMGRLLVEDPGAFRRYQMMISGVHNLAATLQDSTGNQYIALPFSGFLGTGVAAAMGESGLTLGGLSPASLGGSFSSANVIFPLSQGIKPDLGPLAIVPTAQISAMFTELNQNYAGHNKVVSALAGDLADVAGPEAMSQSLWEQIIPNATAQRILQSTMGNDRAFNSAVMESYQLAVYQQAKAEEAWLKGGKKGPEPELIPPANAPAMVKQGFQDRIRNYTRMLFFVRAFAGFVSPVSASVVVQNLGIPQHLNRYIQSHGSVALGMQAAHADHPEWDPWMVSQSYVPSDVNQQESSGYSLASSIPAQEWVTQNQGLLNKYGASALWLMPQLTDSKYSPTIYNEQIAQGLRKKDTPDQFLAALYTNAGNNLYYDSLPVHEAALAAAGKNSRAVNTEYDNWNNYVQKLEQQNPVWAENFLSGDKQLNRTNAIKSLRQMFVSGDAPAGPMTSDVQFLLAQYDSAASDYQVASQAPTYSTQLTEQKNVNDNWINYVTSLEKSEPQLKPIINGIFKEALQVRT